MATGEDRRTRVCFVLQVRPERIEEYRARHAAVWPEMLEALREAGWGNYSLFLRDDGLLVGYLECDDFADCQARMQATGVNARWQMEMAPFFALGGAAPDAAMTPLREVFHLSGSTCDDIRTVPRPAPLGHARPHRVRSDFRDRESPEYRTPDTRRRAGDYGQSPRSVASIVDEQIAGWRRGAAGQRQPLAGCPYKQPPAGRLHRRGDHKPEVVDQASLEQ